MGEFIPPKMGGQRGLAARNARKTHCARGHEFTPENTEYKKRGDGKTQRVCKTCRKRAQARRKKPPSMFDKEIK